MKWFQDLAIARKLAVGFTLTTLMTLILGAFALLRLSEANAQLREMAGNDIPSVQHLGEARSQLGEFRTYELAQLSMLDQPEKVADYNKRMDDTAKAVQAALQKLMDDGTYMKILKHWGVESGAIDKAEINPTDLS